jgi:hypothetical protein
MEHRRFSEYADPTRGALNTFRHRAYFKTMSSHSTLCALSFDFAPLRELYFSQRRKVKTEGAKEDLK